MTPADYDALRDGRGLVVRRERGRLALAGEDRRSFLQGLVTNDVLALEAGQGCYAAMLTPQGRMIADLYVHELGDHLLLDVPAELTRGLAARLEQLIFSEDVLVRDVSAEWAHLTCPSTSVPNLDKKTASVPVSATETGTDPVLGGRPRIVVGPRLPFAVPMVDVFVEAAGAPELLEALRQAGIVTACEEAFEILRIESGVPRWGLDMDGDTIPLEAAIEPRAISLTKGCYVGQEVIIRVLHRGHGRVARRLVRLALPDAIETALPASGEALKKDGRDIGRLTSVAWTPRTGGVALGYVHRDLVEPGTEVVYGDGARARVSG